MNMRMRLMVGIHRCTLPIDITLPLLDMLQKLREVHGPEPSSSFPMASTCATCMQQGVIYHHCRAAVAQLPTALLLASASMVNGLLKSGNKSTGRLHNRYFKVSKALYSRSPHLPSHLR